MSAGESSGSGAGDNHSVVGYDYGTYEDKKSDSNKAPRFNGDPEEISWWKCKGGLDYFQVMEGTNIIALCLSLLSISFHDPLHKTLFLCSRL